MKFPIVLLIGLMAIFSVCDLVTTVVGIKQGGFHECNIFMANLISHSIELFVICKLVITYALSIVLLVFYDYMIKNNYPHLGIHIIEVAIIVCVFINICATVNNTIIILSNI